jgi:hypothetical protein
VRVNRDRYEIFERMHHVCFHYEFEHWADPDEECAADGCPSSLISATPHAAAPRRPGAEGQPPLSLT